MDVFSLCLPYCQSYLKIGPTEMSAPRYFFWSIFIVLRGNGLTSASSNVWEPSCPQHDVFFWLVHGLYFC